MPGKSPLASVKLLRCPVLSISVETSDPMAPDGMPESSVIVSMAGSGVVKRTGAVLTTELFVALMLLSLAKSLP